VTRHSRFAALLVPLLFAPSVWAAPPSAPAKEADLKKRSVAPDASLAGSIEAKGKAGAAAPRLDFDTFRYAVELQVSGKRREEMDDLSKLIRLGGSPEEMPAWLFRLAELHWEEAQYLFFESNRRDDAIALNRKDPAAVARLKEEKRGLEERSKAESEAAITRYKEIAKRFPKYPRLDEVVFFLGENLWKQNRRKEALDAYKVLITRFAKSKYVPDAWMAFGEHYFDTADRNNRGENLRKALGAYQRAAAFQESSVYGFALYKQAWVHYNLGNWDQSLDLFKAVIFFGDLPTTTLAQDKKLALVREAKKDYVRTYSHVGSPKAAPEDFARVGGKDARDMLKSLAQLYFDEGKDREAILVYHGLIVADAAAPDAVLFQSRIVTSAGRMGKKDIAVQQAARFVDMLRDAEKRGGDERARAAVGDARKDAENTLRTLAVQYHNEWKKTREDAVAGLAAELYRLHLDLFPDSKTSYEMRFFHAELLYALEKFQEAGDEYGRVAAIDAKRVKEPGPDGKPQKPGKYLVDALESQVQAFDIVAKRAEANEKRPAGEAKTPLPLPKEKAQLLAACERYLELAPHGEQSVQIAYKAANVYYRYNHFDQAVKLFAEIAQKHPKHELARYAANLALDCFNLQGDWKSVAAWAKRFWDDGELMRAQPSLKDDLAKVIEGSSFKLVEDLEKQKRHAEAAEAYLAFARDFPTSTHASTALFNASVDLVRAGRLERAMQVRDQLLERYPSDPLVPKIVLASAQDREAVADFERAATLFERYFHAWKKAANAGQAERIARARLRQRPPPPPRGDAGGYEEAKARDALYDAGVLREGLGERHRAQADRELFVETWPAAPETAKVFLSIADLHDRAGARTKELKQLEEYQQKYAKDPTEWLAIQGRIARLMERQGNRTGAERAYRIALAYWKEHRSRVGEKGMPVVAQAQYLALEPAFDAYDRISFAVKPKFLASTLKQKAARLAELQKQYTAIVNLKQAEPAVCSLHKVGLGYAHFARALKAAPIPAEIRHQKALVDEYKTQLARFAEEPEKKSVEALEYAMTKARELGVSNACSKAAADVLVRYKPDQYGPPQERLPELSAPRAAPRLAGHGLLAVLENREARDAAARAQASGTALPPLGAAATTAAARARRDPDLPLDDVEEARPAPPRQQAPLPPPVKDEDLLP
jgi:tetratricopeptide (TPR) repeat protein